MADRASAVVAIKGGAIKIFATELEKLLAAEVIDRGEITARYDDLSSSFHKYEEAFENLCVLDKKRADEMEWGGVRSIYYAIARQVAKLGRLEASGNGTLPHGAPIGNSTFIEKSKLPKLPFAKVPTFDGDYEKWLSYKNAFLSIVNTQDVDNVVKLIHLRDSLTGEALNKINIFNICGDSYAKAWQLLVDTYEKKRILVSKHMNAILDIRPAQTLFSKEVSRVVDEAKQHLNVLDGLGVKVDDAMMICILERAIPLKIRKKWEDTLELDELPTLEKFYSFIGKSVFRLCTSEAKGTREQGSSSVKRVSEGSRDIKVRRGNDNARTLVTNSAPACPHCKGPHAIFRCPTFATLTVHQRWEFVQSNKLCINCLRSHSDKCGFGHCKKCEKHHNTLLHLDSKSATPESITSSACAPASGLDSGQTA